VIARSAGAAATAGGASDCAETVSSFLSSIAARLMAFNHCLYGPKTGDSESEGVL
jgi:hypothetical protein